MIKRIWLIVSLCMVVLTSGCLFRYHEAVLVEMPPISAKFHKPLIYEGVVFQKGLYFQGGERGDIIKGFEDTFRENMKSNTLFESVVLRTDIEDGINQIKQPRNALSMVITTNMINEYKPVGFLIYAEMTAAIIILETETRRIVYAKKYYIKRNDSIRGVGFLWKRTMTDLVNKILSDISKGDFDNQSYHDIQYETIEI